VELWIEFPACVVPVRCNNPVAGCAILIGAVLPDACSCVVFGFCQDIADSLIMGGDKALITANHCLN